MIRAATVVLLASAVAAQPATFPHLVLTDVGPGTPASALVEVDPQSGSVLPLGGFSSDALAPLAVAFDPYDGDVLVALDGGAAQSVIVRLDDVGGSWAEFPVAVVPGRVVDLVVSGDDLLAAVDAANGGVYRMPRRGGAATLAVAQPNLTAMQGFPFGGTAIVLAWTGRPGTAVPDSGTGIYDLGAGAFAIGPFSFPNPTGLEITGVVDLPTAVPRQVLSFADGSFAMFAGLIGPGLQPIVAVPAIPPGGAAALHTGGMYSVEPIGLGGAAFPMLYSVDPFSGAVAARSAALPGAPVDFAWGIETSAHSLGRGVACGPEVLGHSWSGVPQLGTTLTSTVQGPANQPVLLAAGLDDFALGQLPAPLPGGCLVEVAPDVLLLFVTNGGGIANQTLSIPATASFVGTVVHTQWVHLGALGFSLSSSAAHWVGV
jgi:hypothetical protein